MVSWCHRACYSAFLTCPSTPTHSGSSLFCSHGGSSSQSAPAPVRRHDAGDQVHAVRHRRHRRASGPEATRRGDGSGRHTSSRRPARGRLEGRPTDDTSHDTSGGSRYSGHISARAVHSYGRPSLRSSAADEPDESEQEAEATPGGGLQEVSSASAATGGTTTAVDHSDACCHSGRLDSALAASQTGQQVLRAS